MASGLVSAMQSMKETVIRTALMLLTALLALSARSARAEAPFRFDAAPGSLPKTVIPTAYRIDLVPDLEWLGFTGHEDVTIDVAAAVDTITLNQAGLNLTRASIEDGVAAAVATDDAAQTATLRFTPALQPGRHTLSIDYAGPIPKTPQGIYRDDYRNRDGVPHRMLVTQFEVADARRMFPGWDEPAFKATFELSVTLPRSAVPVSNMPVASVTSVSPDTQRVVFARTPRMSTYLLALVAGDLASRHARAGGVDIGLWAPAGTEAQGDQALAAASQILPYYNDYFGVAYPLPKLDLIAVPGNYEAGAMENWGAITYIDNALLFDPATSSPSTQESIYLTVAHEMAHQWSGDLVTMGWWDDIWLNEGFATWMATKATDHFNPDWQILPRQHGDREQAMAQDAQPTTHPIHQPIRDISEANAAFDRISYQKGEQVIRMLEDWLGPDVFRDGMRGYMKAHAYRNTTGADLWAALGQVSHRDVADVAGGFTDQPGIPLVHVARVCAGGHTTLTLSEDRFVIHDPEPAKLVWQVPLTLGGPGEPTRRMLLGGTPQTQDVTGCDRLIKLNLGEVGYYRTEYDAVSLRLLKTGFAGLEASDQANLLGDQYALFEAGRAPLSDYLDFAAVLGTTDVTSVAVWEDTIAHLLRTDALLRGDPSRPGFRDFARGLLAPQLRRLGWDSAGGSFTDTILRPQLVAALGELEDPEVTAEAQRRFAARKTRPLVPELLDPVTRIVGMHADLTTWEELRASGEAAPGTEEKLRYFGAMAAAHDPDLMRRNIEFATSGAVPAGRILSFLSMISRRADDPDGFLRAALPRMDPVRRMLGPLGAGTAMQQISGGASDPVLASAILAAPAAKLSVGASLDARKAAGRMASDAALRMQAASQVAAWLKAR